MGIKECPPSTAMGVHKRLVATVSNDRLDDGLMISWAYDHAALRLPHKTRGLAVLRSDEDDGTTCRQNTVNLARHAQAAHVRFQGDQMDVRGSKAKPKGVFRLVGEELHV